MKILLISANTMKVTYAVYPLGLDYVAGALKPFHCVQILDRNLYADTETFGQAVKETSSDLIGISIRNIDTTDICNQWSSLDVCQEVIETVRSVSDAPVVLGGCGFTLFPKELMNRLDADFGIVGEGERFRIFVDELERGNDVSKLPGVLTKNDFVSVPEPWQAKSIRDFNPENPHVPFYLQRGGILNLQSKRGCPFECIYCTYPDIEGRRLRFHDPAAVAREARSLQDGGAKFLYFTDSAFNSHEDHSLAVAKSLVREGVSIPWGGFFAPGVTSGRDYYRILAGAGLTHVEFGTESLSDRMLKKYRKPFRADDVYRVHDEALSAELNVAHFFLLGGPGENETTLEETLNGAEKLQRAVFFFFCGVRIYPKTAMYKQALREGQIMPDSSLLEPIFYQSPEISSEEIYRRLQERAGDRPYWVAGSGGEKSAKILARLHSRGYTGLLWEYLIPPQP
jgi:radical SAM superfamily enzyme YgiQ (UPF0313 family)